MPDPYCSSIDRDTADPRPHTSHYRGGGSLRAQWRTLTIVLLLAALAGPAAGAAGSDPVVTVEETVTTPAPGTTVTTTRTSTSAPPAEPEEPAAVDPVCTAAQTLIDQGRPVDALALIDAERTARGEEAAQLCTEQRRDALLAETTGPEGPIGDADRAWEAIVEQWITPLLGSMLLALGWTALAFVVAVRVLTALPWMHSRRRDRGAQAALAVGAATSAVVALVLIAALLDQRGRGSRFEEGGVAGEGVVQAPSVFWIGPAVLLVVSAVLTAAHLLGRLRVSLLAMDVQGDVDRSKERTTQLIALLGRVGGSPPAGVEIPRGSDVTSLGDSMLLPAPVGAVAKAVLGILAALVGGTPWKVALDYLDDDTAAVVVSRNGRTVQTAELSTSAGPAVGGVFAGNDIEEKRSMLCALAAGVVIVALSRAHPGFEGLGGATDGRSVGLQYVATTTFTDDHRTAMLLLGRALQIDPGNRAADVALQNLLHRRATDAVELRAYRDSLAETADSLQRDGHTLLAQRVLITYFAVLVNLHAAAPTTLRPYDLPQRHLQMEKLLAETERRDRVTEQDPLLLATRQRYAVLVAAVEAEYRGIGSEPAPGGLDAVAASTAPAAGPPTVSAATTPTAVPDRSRLDPHGAYNSALVALQNNEDALAEFLIQPALTSLELRRWIRRDPDVVRNRDRAAVARMAGGGSPARLWDLELFAPHRAACRRAGIATPLALATVGSDEKTAADLGLTTATLRRLADAAGVAGRLWSVAAPSLPRRTNFLTVRTDLAQWRVDLAEIVLDGDEPDVATPNGVVEALRKRVPRPAAEHEDFAAEVGAWLVELGLVA